MDASTVTAICSVVIAVASLAVSAYVARATRKHNRLSVRPLLGLTTACSAGATAGLRLTNSGLGPARIVSSQLTFNEEQFAEVSKPHVAEFRQRQDWRAECDHPGRTTVSRHGYQQFLRSVDPYDPSEHREFRQLLEEG